MADEIVQDVLRARSRSRSRSCEKCRKVLIKGERNLDVSRHILEEALSRVGHIERCSIAGDTASIIFEEARNAREAVRRFDRGTLNKQLITASFADAEAWEQSFTHVSVTKLSGDCVYGPWKCMLPVSLKWLASRTAHEAGLLASQCQFTHSSQVLANLDTLPSREMSNPVPITLVMVEKPYDGQVMYVRNLVNDTALHNLILCFQFYGDLIDVQYNGGANAFVRYEHPSQAWAAATALHRNYRFRDSDDFLETSWCGDMGPDPLVSAKVPQALQLCCTENCIRFERFPGQSGHFQRDDPHSLLVVFETYGLVKNLVIGGTDTLAGFVEFNDAASAESAAQALHQIYKPGDDDRAVEVVWLGSTPPL